MTCKCPHYHHLHLHTTTSAALYHVYIYIYLYCIDFIPSRASYIYLYACTVQASYLQGPAHIYIYIFCTALTLHLRGPIYYVRVCITLTSYLQEPSSPPPPAVPSHPPQGTVHMFVLYCPHAYIGPKCIGGRNICEGPAWYSASITNCPSGPHAKLLSIGLTSFLQPQP